MEELIKEMIAKNGAQHAVEEISKHLISLTHCANTVGLEANETVNTSRGSVTITLSNVETIH